VTIPSAVRDVGAENIRAEFSPISPRTNNVATTNLNNSAAFQNPLGRSFRMGIGDHSPRSVFKSL